MFRRVLRGYSSGRAEPLKVISTSAAVAAKARTRAYFPVQVAMLARCIAILVALGLVYCTLQAVQGERGECDAGEFLFSTARRLLYGDGEGEASVDVVQNGGVAKGMEQRYGIQF